MKVLQVTFSLQGCVVLCHLSGVFIYACPKGYHNVAFGKRINFAPLWNSQARSKFRTRHDCLPTCLILFGVCWVSIISQSSNSSNCSQGNDILSLYIIFPCVGVFEISVAMASSFIIKSGPPFIPRKKSCCWTQICSRWRIVGTLTANIFDMDLIDQSDDGWTSRNIQTLCFAQGFYISYGSPGGPNFAESSFQQGWRSFTMFLPSMTISVGALDATAEQMSHAEILTYRQHGPMHISFCQMLDEKPGKGYLWMQSVVTEASAVVSN